MRRQDAPSQRKARGVGFHPLTPAMPLPPLSLAAPTPATVQKNSSRPAANNAASIERSELSGPETEAVDAAPAAVLRKRGGFMMPRPATAGSVACAPSAPPSLFKAQQQHACPLDDDKGKSLAPPNRLFSVPAHTAARRPDGDADGLRVSRDEEPMYFEVFFTKASKKKHKIWEDGVLVLKQSSMELQREDGSNVTKSNRLNKTAPEEGSMLFFGSFELEIVKTISEEQYIQKGMDQLASSGRGACSLMPPTQSFKAVSKKPLWQKKKEAKLEEKALREQEKAERDPMDILPRGGSNGANAFISRGANVAVDSSRPGAHILNEGANDQLLVCVDPFIGIKLKPHQVEGVRFLYKNLTEDISQRQSAGTQCSVKGCILADEMGLGKTIQTIALIWTVLKQSPVSSTSPLVRKCCVVCPSSLVFNWQNEFKKWLGDQRLPTLAVLKGGKEAADVVQEFVVGSVKPVLIISYDMLRRLSSKLAKGQFDLLICDEAHKLKNINGNHTIDALNSLPASRRILLSGTPVQNDLQEYYSMINFVRPGLLGAPKQFQKLFADSIVKSRDKRCSDHDKIIGRKRLRQLSKLTSSLLLRRTMADKLICSTMPSKTETLVFCNPSSLQHDLYRALLASAETQKLMRVGKPGGSFAVITRVIKLLNHPTLLNRQEQATENPEGDEVTDLTLASIAGTMSVDDDFVKMHFPANYDEHSLVHSGKFQFLFELLRSIKSSSSDRVVLVSSYTTTLDLLQIFLRSAQYTFLRLDGSVNAEKRRHLVESFNRDKSDVFVFLLSSLAGGVGLNLVAANRLVLIDPSWNPAHDYQAMARIWRFGQLSPCHIYRLITTGTMEEKILQKQLRKGELESLVVDGGESSVRNFDSSDLKRIFILEKTSSDTFDVLTANGLASKNASGRVPLEQLHSQRVGGFRCTRPESNGVLDKSDAGADPSDGDVCLAESVRLSAPVVSFIMWRKNTDRAEDKDKQTEGDCGKDDGQDSDESNDSDECETSKAGCCMADVSERGSVEWLSEDDDVFEACKQQRDKRDDVSDDESSLKVFHCGTHKKRKRLKSCESDSE